MSRQVVSSVSAAARLELASAWLVATGARGALVVAPSRGSGDELVREATAAGAEFFGVHRTTPSLLALELATPRLAAMGRLPVTTLSLEALAARAASTAAERLEHLGPVAGYPGFPRVLSRTLNELGGVGVSPADLVEHGPSCRDLVELWTHYVAEMDRARLWEGDELALADRMMVWSAAADSLAAGHTLRGLPILFLDVVPTTPSEGELWRQLVAASPEVLATVPGGDPHTATLEAALESAAVSLDQALDLEAPGVTRLEALRRQVFSSNTTPTVVEDDGSLEIIAAPGEGREAVEIARRAHELALQGVPFDSMAILLRDPASYLGLVEEALDRAGIPAWFTRGTVRPDPAGRALLTLLHCAAEQLSATRFAEYLSLAQVPRAPAPSGAVEVPWVEPDGEQLVFKTLLRAPRGGPAESDAEASGDGAVVAGTLRAPRNWERLLVDAAVVGGHDRWVRRLAGLRAEFEQRATDLDDGDGGTREHLARQIEDLDHLERYALPLIARLAALPARASWGAWIHELRGLATVALRDPTRVLGVLTELEPMEKVDEVGLGEVIRVLQERLTILRAEPEGHRYGKLFVATIEEARGRVFDTVFVPGLAEGRFPRRVTEDPLLLDRLRAKLDARLEQRDDRSASERLLLRVAAGAARHRLVVLYPTLDALQGRARVPSFYALDIVRAAEGVLPDSEGLDARARDRSDALMGWPAPSDHELAIDDAEFDISYLQRVLAKATPADRGRARFLLARNPHLARSLRNRYLRWGKKFTGADGIVTPSLPAERALQAERLRERSYSPTALQHFATCPYKFVLSAIHRLRPRDEITSLERMDPLTRGSLFHDVQYELHCALRDGEHLPVTTANLGAATALGDEVLRRVADGYRDRLAPAIERVWHDEVEGLRTDLRAWIRNVAENETNWVPRYFEFSFGLGQQAGRDPESHRDEAVVFDGYRLRGSIDLVESEAGSGPLRVTDHKTGKSAWKRRLVVDGGEILQPMLYALAAEYHLDEPIVGGRLFYCTRRGGFETRDVELNRENRQTTEQILDLIDAEIARGFLPAAPKTLAGWGKKSSVCKWCDYRPVCGPYEMTRVANKDQSQLNRLKWLRDQP